MAVQAFQANEAVDGYRGSYNDGHSKMRLMPFSFTAGVAGDAGTTIDLGTLPPGRVRVLPAKSRIKADAFGAARTLKIGHTAYQKRDSASEAFEGADDDAFTSVALDVSGATNNLAFDNTQLMFDLYSKSGVLVQALVGGGTIPQGTKIEGYVAYLYE